MTTPAAGSTPVGSGARTVNQIVALVFGVVYTLVAILGFFVSETFAETEDNDLLGIFQVNHLHNIVHLLIGLALIVAAKRHASARAANLAIGLTYLLLGVIGPLLTGTEANIVALNAADHWLHLASGALLTATALLADKGARHSTSV